jgi:hypothetical protein
MSPSPSSALKTETVYLSEMFIYLQVYTALEPGRTMSGHTTPLLVSYHSLNEVNFFLRRAETRNIIYSCYFFISIVLLKCRGINTDVTYYSEVCDSYLIFI